MNNPRFNIIGNGAIGHLWTGFMLRNQLNAKLYTRNLKAKKKVLFDSPIGSFETTINYLTLDDWQSPDYILICVKAHQLDELCQKLKTKETKNCPIILMMNGLGLVEIVKSSFPRNSVLQASITHGALKKDNKIFHTGLGQTILGNINFNYSAEQFDHLITLLNRALPEVIWSDNFQEAILMKMIINSIINPTTAILKISNGELINNNQLIPFAQTLLEETSPLIDIILPSYTISDIAKKVINVAKSTEKNSSSMRVDIENNKPTEIDFINGYLIQLAEKHAIALPEHERLIKKIKQLGQN